ncbi:Na+/H+ antiporter NhaA [Desulfopila sp. IMCC35006]|uniref:Na+/H+ antiporter NhaA n=1 Tax=Desulfopila sp. IMCC35006 TaxID=2569542 RepID=UPI0010AD2D17|nr:Na+/H+ antiporter NhaA [Desulfopila sp. IMCC35006]TKB25102.1 Na+/H+ antiporter NhaA [Desulfopila sp. IMCC35006]
MKDRIILRFSDVIHSESGSGLLLMVTAVLAMILANTPLSGYYDLIITTPVHIRIGPLEIAKPLLLWVNDGLMASFFFLVGLELKREILIGELSDISKVTLPALGALGGMVVPSLIYIGINYQDPIALRGWAIPAATDIAFALGILSLLGSRVPISLKVLLTSLAVFDDIGAIIIIALFYTENISLAALIVAAVCICILFYMNRRGQENFSMYVFVGSIMWVALLKSGVHATLAGILLAIFIPMRSRTDPDLSPLMEIEHDLHSAVNFFVLPIFAFCNSGITLANTSLDFFSQGVPMGIALGLFFGKQAGIFTFIGLAILLKVSAMPKGMTWGSLYGMATLCGIGFTMSLFIGSLAFDQTSSLTVFDQRLGIILGSLVSGLVGFLILKKILPASSI